MINTLSFLAFMLSITGNFFINAKRRYGFIIWIVSNILWIVINFIGEINNFQIAMFATYIMFSIAGFREWKLRENKQVEHSSDSEFYEIERRARESSSNLFRAPDSDTDLQFDDGRIAVQTGCHEDADFFVHARKDVLNLISYIQKSKQ